MCMVSCKKDFADVIKDMGLEMERFPQLTSWAQSNHVHPYAEGFSRLGTGERSKGRKWLALKMEEETMSQLRFRNFQRL